MLKKGKDTQAEENTVEKVVVVESQKKKGVIRRFLDNVCKVIGLCVVLFIAADFIRAEAPKVIDYVRGNFSSEPEVDVNKLIEEELTSICEVAVAQYHYSDTLEDSDHRKIWKISIPGSERSVSMDYTGTIKVGYDQIEWSVTENAGGEPVLNVILPEAKVLSHEFAFTEIDEDNNPFNFPYGSEEYMEYEEEIKAAELKKAEEKGIYKEAESTIKDCIRNFADQLDGYTLNFE